MNDRERIVVDPGIRSGKPCIRGTCIAVSDIFDDLTAPDIPDRRGNVLPHQAAP
jgi:uncharacterized protein (DUF433 family)